MRESSLRWYLVRHGVTEWNKALRMQGHSDIALDEEGVAQAQRVAERLASADLPPEAVWTSDLQRARCTAQAIADRLGLPLVVTPLLRETMLGAWEGLTREEIEERGEGRLLRLYRLDPQQNRPPEGETLEAVWDRMQQAAAEIRACHPEGQVAVVGHGGSLRALICDALDAPITSMRRVWLDNASISVIEEVAGASQPIRRVTLLNDTGHLQHLKPPDPGVSSP